MSPLLQAMLTLVLLVVKCWEGCARGVSGCRCRSPAVWCCTRWPATGKPRLRTRGRPLPFFHASTHAARMPLYCLRARLSCPSWLTAGKRRHPPGSPALSLQCSSVLRLASRNCRQLHPTSTMCWMLSSRRQCEVLTPTRTNGVTNRPLL